MTGKKTIHVATSTWYPEHDTRADLALQTLEGIQKLPNVYAVVSDGGSYKGFENAVMELGAHYHRQVGPTMHDARVEAIEVAMKLGGKNGIFEWMELEKEDYVQSIIPVAEPIIAGTANTVFPNRLSLDSLPVEQKHSETFAGLLCTLLFGIEDEYGPVYVDEYFGPLAGDYTAMRYLLDFKPERFGLDPANAGWWMNHLPRLIMRANPDLKIAVKTVPYKHPAAQTKEEEGNLNMAAKRLIQLLNILPAMISLSLQLGLLEGKEFNREQLVKQLAALGVTVPQPIS